MGASQSALSIQNPSQTGPRTQSDGDFETRGAASAISTTAPVEGSADIPAIGLRALRVPQRTHLVCQAIPLPFELHVNPGASGVDINASLG